MSVGTDLTVEIGGFQFAEAGTRIHTLLGSCVAIVLWHPQRRIGGMCHYLLPTPSHDAASHPPGRSADGAMSLFLAELLRRGTRPQEYVARMYGGGNMFSVARTGPVSALQMDVAARNVAAGHRVLRAAGIVLQQEDTGGAGSRRLAFDVASGRVEVVRGAELGR